MDSFIDQFRRDVEAWQHDHRPEHLYTDDQLIQLKEYARTHRVSEAEWAFVEASMKNSVLRELWWWVRANYRSPMTSIMVFCNVLLTDKIDGPLTSIQRTSIKAIQDFADSIHAFTLSDDSFLTWYWEKTGNSSK
jgi:hypothetical protein